MLRRTVSLFEGVFSKHSCESAEVVMTVATNAEVGTTGEVAPTTAGVAGTTTAAPGLVNNAVLL